MRAWLVVFSSLLGLPATHGQEKKAPTEAASFTVGIGGGLDFGGLGIQVSSRPEPPLNLFAGVGYNFGGLGFNGGIAWRALPRHIVCPFLLGMFGYNAVIALKDKKEFKKIYYGPTAGAGIEVRAPNWRGHLELAVLYPFRSKNSARTWRTCRGIRATGISLFQATSTSA
ncbi:MAG: hypothetical protein IPK99_15370 [Flavobacteriales bacterium]|nr:hypothetical protein [Flavobacteriales bacterium]